MAFMAMGKPRVWKSICSISSFLSSLCICIPLLTPLYMLLLSSLSYIKYGFKSGMENCSFAFALGYNRFYRIDQLESEGYLSNDLEDCIYLKYYVRPPNYHILAQDQLRYIQ